jgi:hypothetical protein
VRFIAGDYDPYQPEVSEAVCLSEGNAAGTLEGQSGDWEVLADIIRVS